MITLEVVDSNLEISNGATKLNVIPLTTIGLDSIRLYESNPLVVLYNVNVGKNEILFEQIVADLKDSVGTTFNVSTFLTFYVTEVKKPIEVSVNSIPIGTQDVNIISPNPLPTSIQNQPTVNIDSAIPVDVNVTNNPTVDSITNPVPIDDSTPIDVNIVTPSPVPTEVQNILNDPTVNMSTNKLGRDAWGRAKSMADISILHGVFTYSIPIEEWFEKNNGTTIVAFNRATSLNGKLNLTAGGTFGDSTILRTYRSARYQPNRGQLYSTAVFLPDIAFLGTRRFGFFTEESGSFFELTSTGLYAVIRTTLTGVTSDDRYLIDTTGIDLTKGNIYDIQMQWRGVGNYRFFINLIEVKHVEYLGTRIELSMFNPSTPMAMQCINGGNNVVLQMGCCDLSSEGGVIEGYTYIAQSVPTLTGAVAITGYNAPLLAIRGKNLIGTLLNTRDLIALKVTAYGDQKSVAKIWLTNDLTAITPNLQTWTNFRLDGFEYIVYNTPVVVTPMTFNSALARLLVAFRVNIDTSYEHNLQSGIADIYIAPNQMIIITMQRENGGNMSAGTTFEFGLDI